MLLAVAGTGLAAHSSIALADQPCRLMEYERNPYNVCEVDLRKHTVRLYWKRSNGTPYAYLSALPRTLEGEVGKLLFATNAGMFDPPACRSGGCRLRHVLLDGNGDIVRER